MSKLAVIYWSQTGNTQAMAEAIAEGAREAGADVELLEVPAVSAADAVKYERLALGCPAMGAEVLEEGDFEPFFTELEPVLGGKKVALFGSYGWGDGQWMRDWQDRVDGDGAQLYAGEGLICNDAPDEEALAKCKAFGQGFAAF